MLLFQAFHQFTFPSFGIAFEYRIFKLDRRKTIPIYLACSVKDFGGELLIQNGIQRRIFVVTNVQIENIIVENVNMKYIKWIKHKMCLNTYPLAEAENKRASYF
ncbi:hypothetical protein T06_8645 [Trichinella sp. T6]|nr:hypothetical protein T06_8645 [Trichinella sp. T6]